MNNQVIVKDVVKQLVDAVNRGDIEAALALYEPEATLVAEGAARGV